MEIIYKIKQDFIRISACDLCGHHIKPKGAKKIIAKSSNFNGGRVLNFYICERCRMAMTNDKNINSA